MTIALANQPAADQGAASPSPLDAVIRASENKKRGIQLVAGIAVMVLLSNYQYSFTLFTPGMSEQFPGMPYSKIALIFSIFVLFETWPVPVAGVLIDTFGIRRLMIAGSILVSLGWIAAGTTATSVTDLYLWYGVVTGLGTGIIYLAIVANAIKWFPDRRGLAAGLTAAGFGGGSALTPIPISLTIHAVGWGHAMAIWGTIQGGAIFALALVVTFPPQGWTPIGWVASATKSVVQSKVDYSWRQTLGMPEFYLLYFIHFLISLGGLMTLGNLSEIARSLQVEKATILGISIVAFAATANGIANTASRILWGSTSDRLGRENTMTVVFLLEAVSIFLVTQITGNPVLFVILFPIVFLGYGQINTLLSATTGDLFGTRNVSANFGMIYTGKGAAAIFSGWGAAVIASMFAGSFAAPYDIAAACDVLAAALAFFALKPIARKTVARTESRALDIQRSM
jgi:OFA family oxalate/formate antiporter-like MFS transporter